MSYSTFLIRRLLLVPVMLVGVTLVVFAVTRLVPADPLAVIVSEKAMDNPQVVQAAVEKWGLDRSLPEQYLRFLGNLLHGDLGLSFKTRRPVAMDLTEFLPATLELTFASMLFALLLGIPLGIIAALRAGGWTDRLIRLVTLLGTSTPPFWSGLVALFFLYYHWGLLPGPGRIDTRMVAPPPVTNLYTVDALLARDGAAFLDVLRHLLLPAVVLGSIPLAIIARLTRASLLETLQMPYVTTARSKGLTERVVVLRHALRNALIPVVTVIGLSFASLMSGAVMTETVFAWPGLGRYMVEASANLDYPAIMGGTLIIATTYIFVNLIVDLSYGLLDPRVRG